VSEAQLTILGGCTGLFVGAAALLVAHDAVQSTGAA